MKLIKTTDVLQKLDCSRSTFFRKVLTREDFPRPVPLVGSSKNGSDLRFVEEDIDNFIKSLREKADDRPAV